MKYAHIKDSGQLLGWYDKNINTLIPTPSIKVSDEAWQNAINNNHNKVNADGTTEAYDFRTDDEKARQDIETKIAEAKSYLESTDFKMTVDYYATLTAGQQLDLTTLRAEARAFLKGQGL